MRDRYAGRRKVTAGLGLAMGFHSAHNALAVASEWIGGTFIFVLAVCLWYYANRRIKTALAQSPFAPGAPALKLY